MPSMPIAYATTSTVKPDRTPAARNAYTKQAASAAVAPAATDRSHSRLARLPTAAWISPDHARHDAVIRWARCWKNGRRSARRPTAAIRWTRAGQYARPDKGRSQDERAAEQPGPRIRVGRRSPRRQRRHQQGRHGAHREQCPSEVPLREPDGNERAAARQSPRSSSSRDARTRPSAGAAGRIVPSPALTRLARIAVGVRQPRSAAIARNTTPSRA